MTSLFRRCALLAAATVTVCMAVAMPTNALEPVTPSDWLKPGTPLSGQGHADPSVAMMGPMMFSVATNHGGPKLPSIWGTDGVTWTARSQIDRNVAKWNNDAFGRMPAGRQNSEVWASTLAFVGKQWVSYQAIKIADGYTSYGRFAIYGATSPTPNGPFTRMSDRPIVSTSTTSDPGGAIDPEVYVDDVTGTPYLLWKTEGNLHGNYPTIWSRQLNSSGTGFASGSRPAKLITRSQSWEGKVVENPSMIRYNGRLLLFYSGNDYVSTNYATGYAECSRPTGPCRKSSRNPILRSASGSYGPGGADPFVDTSGRLLAGYHAYSRAVNGRGDDRVGRTIRVAEFGVSSSSVWLRRRTMGSTDTSDSIWYGKQDGAFTPVRSDLVGLCDSFVGDINGDGRDDLGRYGTWTRGDRIILSGSKRGELIGRSMDQRGSFLPVGGDFDGDGRGDVFWYAPGQNPAVANSREAGSRHYEPDARNDALWLSTGSGWKVTELAADQTAIPLPGDFNGDGRDEILWYAPGTGRDSIWRFDTSGSTPTVRSTALTIEGDFRPVIGDLDGDGDDDVFWYGPGRRTDAIWWMEGGVVKQSTKAAGHQIGGSAYRPVAGDFDGDGRDEILWYGPGGLSDSIWSGITPQGAKTSTATKVGGNYRALVGDFDGDGIDDIRWIS